ncbi:MAG TPA: glycosyl hydrolase [Telluria sp.]|jgi:hypothetical protein
MTTAFQRRRQLLGLIATSAGLSACGGGGNDTATAMPVATTPVTAVPETVTMPVTTPVATPVATPVTEPVATPAPATGPATVTEPAPVAEPAPKPVTPVIAKSAKRGIAYELTSAADMQALAPGVSWYYNWGTAPKINLTVAAIKSTYQMDYFPMIWNANNDPAAMTAYLLANPGIKYLLLLNEPNLVDQANLSPADAAAQWPRFEAIARATGVKLVGPAITWGTMANYSDPVKWMDAFLAAYQAANGGRSPQIDYLAFHWYDYGLAGQLDSLLKYGKPVWVTEMANWHSQNDGAQIDTLARQKEQMTAMVKLCEERADVFRYAWFIGRMGSEGDPHFTSLLGADGVLTKLGELYVSLPYKA